MTKPIHPVKGMAASIRDGRKFVNGFCSLPAPIIAEMLGRQGFDSVTIDLQHGMIGYDTALNMVQAINAAGTMSLCRVPANDEAAIGKVLDAGFSGVICPMINSAAEARRFVSAGRYPPVGRRSWGPIGAGQVFGPSYTEHANDFITLLAMIETVEAVAAIDEILDVDGLDGIYIGPSDLALSLGYAPADPSAFPQVMATIDTVRKAAKRVGKIVGIHCNSAEMVADCLSKGFDLATFATDFALLRSAIQAGLAKLQAKASANPGSVY